ncbi:hypothetical protein BDP55DRAFT_637776 [Colletotrichum godetiae]|uniref:Uncharacterized protein n=1 Tax=Colletotrichum godetiae TaxID=1209918 RepID=A0AAJ0ABI3_9PEZI|nr:uncharacterized protein BDP55DRAFT_637776 [Colletotrichum godetiae]KAK1658552.1 hypothetical protein BDP55DRAFT_637776 [Colletotrichum godetiae]
MSRNVDKPTHRSESVYAVREDQEGRQTTFIDQLFRLKITFLHGSVCFRLSVGISNGDNNPFRIYLQVTPDRLHSLEPTNCNLNDESTSLKMAMYRQGCTNDVCRLHFRLHSGVCAQLIVPMDFGCREILDESGRRGYDSLASLAATSSFSVYVPYNTTIQRQLDQCQTAVKCFSKFAENRQQLRSFQLDVDPQRLYAGKGGRVVDHRDRTDFQPDWERDGSTTPATIDYEDDPRYLGLPPQYDGYPGQGLTTTSADVPNLSESPAVDCAPPDYSATERPPDGPRIKRASSMDDDAHQSSKRICSIASTPTLGSIGDGQQLDVKPGSQHGLTLQLARLERCVMQCQNRIIQREEDFRGAFDFVRHRLAEVENQNASLSKRLEEVEGQNASLSKRPEEIEDQDESTDKRMVEVEDRVEILDTRVLEAEQLGQQVPDTLDEMRELAKDTMADVINEHMEEGCGGDVAVMKKYVHKYVATGLADLRTKICQALQD